MPSLPSSDADLYRALFEALDTGFCVIEVLCDAAERPVDYRFVQANAAFVQHTGLKDVIGRTVSEVVPDLDPWWIQTYGKVALTGEPVRFQNQAAAMGRWFDVYAFRVGDPAARWVGIYFTDTSERQRAEAELRAAEQRLAEVFQRAPSFMCILRGPEHVFERANDRYNELVGHRPLIGRTVLEALPEVEGQGFLELLDRVYRTGEPHVGREMPVSLRPRPEEAPQVRYVDFVYQAIRDPVGRINGVFAQGIDLTERKKAEAALREGEERLRLILANVKDHAIMTLDLEGRITAWNRGAERLFGYATGEILGQPPDLLFTDADRRAGRPQQELQGAAATGASEDERYHVRRDGSQFFASGSLEALRDEKGQLRGYVKVVRDITQQRQVDEQRDKLLQAERSARAEAERIGRMKDEFLATLSHELRTPLSAILGWAQMLSDPAERDDATLEDGLGAILRNARAQARLIDDLLDMSRIISGNTRLDVRPVALAEVVGSALGAVELAAQAKGVTLTRELPEDVRLIDGDPTRLQQVVWNLLTNAIKFTPQGGRVHLALTPHPEAVELKVSDNGQGIPPQFLPHLFERFRQADASTTRAHGGLGIGLSIVKHLVELHGGTIRAESLGEGTGSTFTVTLPRLSRTAEKPSASVANTLPRPSPPSAPSLSLQQVRVLVVDDEPDARALLRRLLSARGADVEVADSAAAALSALPRFRPHVLVSDIGLPHEDGYRLIERVRALPPEAGGAVPAIALTAFARPEDRQRALAAGYQRHITKPVEPAALLVALASLLPSLRSDARI